MRRGSANGSDSWTETEETSQCTRGLHIRTGRNVRGGASAAPGLVSWRDCRFSWNVGAIRESPHTALPIRRALSGSSRTAPTREMSEPEKSIGPYQGIVDFLGCRGDSGIAPRGAANSTRPFGQFPNCPYTREVRTREATVPGGQGRLERLKRHRSYEYYSFANTPSAAGTPGTSSVRIWVDPAKPNAADPAAERVALPGGRT